MKRVLYLFLAVIISATALRAELKQDMSIQAQTDESLNVKRMVLDALNDRQIYEDELLPTGGSLNKITNGVYNDAIFTNYYDLTPMVYEPKSGYIFIVKPHRFVPEGDNVLTGKTDILYSTDKGSTWMTLTIKEERGHVPVYSSLAVMNPSGSNNVNDMVFYIFSTVYKFDGNTEQPNYNFDGFEYLVKDVRLDANFIDEYETGPVSGNNGSYNWSIVTRTAHYDGNGKEAVLNYSTLSPDENSQFGVYGVGYWFWDLSKGVIEYSSAIPIGWDINQFRKSDNVGSTYNTGIQMDFDENGVAYAGVFNLMAENPDKRIPAVSKSTDFGKTWTEFEAMPVTVMDEFYQSQGGIYTSSTGNALSWNPGSMAYGTMGFAVTGEDEYSFVFRFYVFTSDTTAEPMICEAYKKDGVWGINKVNEMNYVSTLYFAYNDPMTGAATGSYLYGMPLLDDVGTDAFRDSIVNNPRHLEIQLAKTADNKNIVIKYLDTPLENETNMINPPVTLNGGRTTVVGTDTWPEPLSEIINNDIFVGYRNLDGGSWTVNNVTQNNNYYKQTWMPKIVPSVSEVPILTSRTIRENLETAYAPGYPPILALYFANSVIDQQAMFSLVDPTDGIPITDVATSVETNEIKLVEINKIYPNPTTDRAEIVFTTSDFGNVNIALYDALGNKIQDVANANRGAGLHAVVINDLEKLTSGTYFVTLNFNGVVITEPLTIVR